MLFKNSESNIDLKRAIFNLFIAVICIPILKNLVRSQYKGIICFILNNISGMPFFTVVNYEGRLFSLWPFFSSIILKILDPGSLL